MNARILETLEFDKVKKLLEPLVVTEQGQRELEGLGPMTEVTRIQQAFDELKDMADLFVHYPHFSLGATQEIGPAMRRLDLETVRTRLTARSSVILRSASKSRRRMAGPIS